MAEETVELSELLRHMAECPPDYRLPVLRSLDTDSETVNTEKIYGPAILGDTLLSLGLKLPSDEEANAMTDAGRTDNALSLSVITCYLFQSPAFRTVVTARKAILELVCGVLDPLARLVPPGAFVDETERREELVRNCLSYAGILPAGETQSQAKDRLIMIDSIERQKVIEKTRQAQIRAQKLKEEMERQRAREAASKMSYE